MKSINILFVYLTMIWFCLALSQIAFGQDSVQEIRELNESKLPSRIAFGSCGHQDKPQPILNQVVARKPDLFIYLGDNIYGDTKDMTVLKAKYEKLGSKPEFVNLRKEMPVLSVWDDHDYGWNDAGKEYPFKDHYSSALPRNLSGLFFGDGTWPSLIGDETWNKVLAHN